MSALKLAFHGFARANKSVMDGSRTALLKGVDALWRT